MNREAVLRVDDLAQEIRRVDGSHSLGAGALAEALMPFLQRYTLAAAPEPVAWLIEFPAGNGELNHRFVYLHNAVGDYRYIHPAATFTPLYR